VDPIIDGITVRKPHRLEPGARIAVVAPSSPFEVAAFERGVERLRQCYEVTFDPGVLTRTGYLAGDDERRATELLEALRDPAVDAIVAARGGYGATRLVEHIEVTTVAEANKLLVGFSDITALHALWARAGVRSLHGPMVAALGRCTQNVVDEWLAAVRGNGRRAIDGLRPVTAGIAEGPLLGGNLAVLAALVGTPYALPTDGCVLLLEDVGERPYRIDRMLTTLRQARCLSRNGSAPSKSLSSAACAPAMSTTTFPYPSAPPSGSTRALAAFDSSNPPSPDGRWGLSPLSVW
jgi:muramoyltetrapeptide carboxypeptidase